MRQEPADRPKASYLAVFGLERRREGGTTPAGTAPAIRTRGGFASGLPLFDHNLTAI
jgi:hypothetical protein